VTVTHVPCSLDSGQTVSPVVSTVLVEGLVTCCLTLPTQSSQLLLFAALAVKLGAYLSYRTLRTDFESKLPTDAAVSAGGCDLCKTRNTKREALPETLNP